MFERIWGLFCNAEREQENCNKEENPGYQLTAIRALKNKNAELLDDLSDSKAEHELLKHNVITLSNLLREQTTADLFLYAEKIKMNLMKNGKIPEVTLENFKELLGFQAKVEGLKAGDEGGFFKAKLDSILKR